MKPVGLVCTGVLLLFFETIAPTYTKPAQQETEHGKPQQGEQKQQEKAAPQAKLNTPDALSNCLPPGIKLDDIVSTKVVGYIGSKNIVRTTVDQTLRRLNVVCKNDKPVDASGKEIYFYRLTGCWGNPPTNYNEILKKQQNEVVKLKQQYTVVEMTCNPSGRPIL
jgi:hypothetical protein